MNKITRKEAVKSVDWLNIVSLIPGYYTELA